MKAGGALVQAADADTAARQAVADARASLGAQPPSFAVLFASPHFAASAPALVAAVAEQAGGVPLIGCVAQAVAGGTREVESGPAVSLWLAADLGPVETFAMEFVQTASGGAFGGYRFTPGVHLMVCDPFTFPAGDLLTHLNQHVPGAAALPGREQELLARGAHLGIVIDEFRTEPGQGDFLVRGIAGADPESGAIAVGGELEVGQTVQFHVRDARSADEDLRRALEREAAALGARPAAGALLFTCTGRGTRMLAEPDHDTGLLAQALGQIPVAGFFCGGELGPVGGQNFLHTFTASIALFPAGR